MVSPFEDRSNGYESVASAHMVRREERNIGVATVRGWARTLPRFGRVLDLGCGYGLPLSKALVDDGFGVYGVDASPRMVAAFRRRLPRAHVACEPVEESPFFGLSFDGVLAWGLLFLLTKDVQRHLMQRVAAALNPTGRFLFTAPAQAATWPDALTGRESRSLGSEAYKTLLSTARLGLVGERMDEGENHYYEVARES